MVAQEGGGWLLPRFAPPPWEKFVPEAWRISDESDLSWVLPRLRPTPFGHFKEPIHRKNATAERLRRTYIAVGSTLTRCSTATQRSPGAVLDGSIAN
jgi:hypothetical protein